MSYSNGISALYRFPAATLTSAAVVGRIEGPDGAEGRLISVTTVVTTGVTVAAASVEIGLTGDTDQFGSVSVPISSAGARTSAFTRGTDNRIDVGDEVEVYTDGGATAGAADICVLIEWYGGDAS